MSQSSKTPRRSRKEQTPASKPAKEEVAHYTAILVEDLRSQFKLVIEHVEGMREGLRREMAEGFKEVHARLDLHEQYLKENTARWETNEKRWETNEKRWETNEKRWQENEKRWQENEKRWQENEVWQRENIRLLSKMDDRLERIENKLDNHEERISHLEARV